MPSSSLLPTVVRLPTLWMRAMTLTENGLHLSEASAPVTFQPLEPTGLLHAIAKQ